MSFNTKVQARTICIPYFNGESGSDSLVAGDCVVTDLTDPTKVLKTTTEGHERIIGVVVGETTDENELVFVASHGVTTIKVTGTVAVNDYLITSTTSGRAKSATSGRILGRALTANVSGEGTVDAMIMAGAIGGVVTDHNTLTNRTGDQHTNHAYLLGRAGGQTIIGGTASGDDLTLQSTSHATRGYIYFGANSFYDEINDRLGINCAASLTADLEIGSGTALTDPWSGGGVTGIKIIPSSGQALLALESDTRSSIGMSNTSHSENNRTIELLTDDSSTYFRMLNDDLSLKIDKVLCMQHSTGNVSIGTKAPNSCGIFEIVSTTKGLILSRMTTVQRDAVSSPVAGLVIFNTTTSKINVYNGSAWRVVDDSAI